MRVELEKQKLVANLTWRGRPLRIDFSAGSPIAIVLDPHGRQPSFYSVDRMHAEPLRNKSFVGDVRLGGSCNAELLHWAPHCHGTHTEGIGHILHDRRPVLETIDPSPVLARLVSVEPDNGLIRAKQLRAGRGLGDHSALILRTLPNPVDKQWRNYSEQPDYPVLDTDALTWLAGQAVQHLLLDTPSLDRPGDKNLTNHRAWWGEDDSIPSHGFPPENRSVTEMIFIDDAIPDGEYWLQLELASIRSDAVPSRPVIYPVLANDEPES